VGPRACLEDMEKKKFLPLPGLELRPFDRPARTDYTVPAPLLKTERDGEITQCLWVSCLCYNKKLLHQLSNTAVDNGKT
jgi:hypothetical protein